MKKRIVLVHGILNTGHIMYWMKYFLQKKGYECYSPTLWPIDGRKGIEDLAQKLKNKLDTKYGDDQNINIVGFSMGGIVARYYIQELDGQSKVDNFFAISAPFQGTWWAYLPYPSKTIKQLRPKSEFLRKMSDGAVKLKNVNLFSYWSPIDSSIIPPSSSHWGYAKNKKIFAILHLFMVTSMKIIRDIDSVLNKQK